MKFRNLRRGEEKKHFEMLNSCFGPWGSEEKWRSKYLQEGFDVTENVLVVEENGEWIGGCTSWLREAFLKGSKKVKVQISGDGYAHPNHTGKGVYSTSVQILSERGRKKGASLSLGFVSAYLGPIVALSKRGFVDAFYPETKILVLNPEKFFQSIIAQLQNVRFPRKLEGIKLRLHICVKHVNGKTTVHRLFQINRRKLNEITYVTNGNVDLEMTTDVETLFEIFRPFLLKKRGTLLIPFVALLRRRLRLRFSARFAKRILELWV